MQATLSGECAWVCKGSGNPATNSFGETDEYAWTILGPLTASEMWANNLFVYMFLFCSCFPFFRSWAHIRDMKEIGNGAFSVTEHPYKRPLVVNAWVRVNGCGIHHNKTAIQSHSNNVKPSQRYKAYSLVFPKLLVAGLPPPFHTHAFTTEGCLYGCSVTENGPFPISFMFLI
ncbi:hypothetical protein CDAR_46481 [Caerostris darwini]|uniref:Uncharacterized protein n=1 Tax=Caerostris darwini TaxID=1538125 RepID=A0AAV4S492_9ARAC|nr:hypothetical protein CDAR_46481 [Caerostris darwini]